jgi:hypothetical protein
VLLASRGRRVSLLTAIRTLYDSVTDRDELELIVAADPDDVEMSTVSTSPFWPASAHLWVAPERYGYNNLHLYLNALAKQATGEWLMWFNDDMRMLTPGWDRVIREHRPAVIWPHANHVHHANIAPAWPKAWSDATGCASPSSHMDTYWQRVGEALGRHDPVDIEIMHDRADVTGNHDDQTYAEGRKMLGAEGMVPGFDGAAFHQQVAMDADVIRRLL